MNLNIDDQIIINHVNKRVDEVIAYNKIPPVTIDLLQLSEITSLPNSTLKNEVINQKEIISISRVVGERIVYLYPEVVEAYKTVIDRLNMK